MRVETLLRPTKVVCHFGSFRVEHVPKHITHVFSLSGFHLLSTNDEDKREITDDQMRRNFLQGICVLASWMKVSANFGLKGLTCALLNCADEAFLLLS